MPSYNRNGKRKTKRKNKQKKKLSASTCHQSALPPPFPIGNDVAVASLYEKNATIVSSSTSESTDQVCQIFSATGRLEKGYASKTSILERSEDEQLEETLQTAAGLEQKTSEKNSTEVNCLETAANSKDTNSSALSLGNTDQMFQLYTMINTNVKNSSEASMLTSTEEKKELQEIGEIKELTIETCGDTEIDSTFDCPEEIIAGKDEMDNLNRVHDDLDFIPVQPPAVVKRRTSFWKCCGLLDIFAAILQR